MKTNSAALTIVLYTEGLYFSGNTIEKQALGGSETAFIYVARKLAEMGHRVYAYCPCSEPGVFHGVVYNDTAELKVWFEKPCDIFICSRFFYVFFQPIQARAKLLWLHDIFIPQNVAAFKLIQNTLNAVFCLSDFHCELTMQILPSVKPLLRKSINAIDHKLVENARAAVGKKKHRIMFTSRPERGLMRALEIYERLDDRSLELIVCSYRSLEDAGTDKIEQECNQKILALNRKGFIVSKSSFPKAELYKHIAESKLVLYPTDFPEIFCISAIEAQACGTVILTSDSFAMKETVFGMRIPLHDMNGFYNAAKFLIYNDEERHEAEEAGLQFVKSYTWDSVANQFLIEAMQHFNEDVQASHAVTMLSESREFKSNLPLISCLTLSYNRLPLLKQAIACYCKQTYPNTELIIVSSGDQRYHDAITRYISLLDRNDIRLVKVQSKSPVKIGALRNISLDHVQGELICNWDDDDLYHPMRIEMQYRSLLEKNATVCYMTDHLQFFEPQQKMYWIDWKRLHSASLEQQCIPGSMLAFHNKSLRYNEHQHLGEDGSYRRLQLQSGKEILATLNGYGYLYIYRFHGRNSYALSHYQHITAWGNSSFDYLRTNQNVLMEALSHYPLPKPIAIKDNLEKTVFMYA